MLARLQHVDPQPTRYRVATGSIDMRSFLSAVFTEGELKGPPDQPSAPRSKWYCHGEHCPVRGVTVEAKYEDGPPPFRPEMYCPSCQRRMELIGYLNRPLVLVPDAEDEQA